MGFMLFTRTLRFLEKIPDQYSEIREALIKERDRGLISRNGSHTATQFMWTGGVKNLVKMTGKRKEDLSKEMLKLNLYLIVSSPLEYLDMVMTSFATMIMPSVTPLSFFGSRFVQLLWSLLHFGLLFVIIICLSFFIVRNVLFFMQKLIGATYQVLQCKAANRSDEPVVEWTAWIIIIYTAIISCALEVGDPRYLKPVMAFLIMISFLFISQWGLRLSKQ